MRFNIEELFKDHQLYIKVKTKKDYKAYFEKFNNENGQCLTDIFSDIDSGKEVTDVAKEFAQDVFDTFAKKNKIRQGKIVPMNYHMIYYIFPTILQKREEDGTVICDAIRDAWNEKCKCNIDYADYETLEGAFVTKFFGIPINGIGFGKRD